jgi:non-ribosomal peptide synthetase component F
LLENILAHPSLPLSEIPLLTVAEEQLLLTQWNETTTDFPSDKCLHQLFEEQVERTPDAVAVVSEDERVSYRELNQRANRLAHYLRRLGVCADELVGICVKRSVMMVVGVLGIMKAGGGYVALDGEYPLERLSFMMEDAGIRVLLTDEEMARRLPEHGARAVYLDRDWGSIERDSVNNPSSLNSGESVAYAIYTSGSTGRPKGILVPQRAVNRLVCNTNYIKLDQSDRVAQASNFAFDAATFEIWGALVHGAQLVIMTKDVVLSSSEFCFSRRPFLIISRGSLPKRSALYAICCSEAKRLIQGGPERCFGVQRRSACFMFMVQPRALLSPLGIRCLMSLKMRRPFPSVARSQIRRRIFWTSI